MPDTTQRIDVRGMACSDAVVKLHRTIMALEGGACVAVVADDEDVLVDLRKYARRGGHRWVAERSLGGSVVEAEVARVE